MIENEFFGLKKRPFFAEPAADAYCPFGGMEYARGQITRCVEQQEGIALVAGLSGVGKTLLCRTLEKQFLDKMDLVPLNGKNLNHPKAFYETLFSRLGLKASSDNLSLMRADFMKRLDASDKFQSGLLLLIDDAHACSLRVFEEVRQLMDSAHDLERGVRVVLFGNASLEEKLSFRQLAAFSQRITTRCFLESFNRDETTAFLRAELKQAGDEAGLFSKEVCRAIHKFADGLPRLVNQLANHVLVTAFEERQQKINAENRASSNSIQDDSTENAEGLQDSDVLSNVDSDSALDSGRFAEWDNPFASLGVEQKKDVKKDSPLASLDDNESKILFQISPDEITPRLVERAWYALQQFKTENRDLATDASVASSVSNNSETNAPVSSSIEFGSLDDDFTTEQNDSARIKSAQNDSDQNNSAQNLSAPTPVPQNTVPQSDSLSFGELDADDSEHTIDYGEVSSDDSTMIWKYDEAQEVSDAVDEANAMPEEWDESARENAQHEVWNDSDSRMPIAGENHLRVPDSVQENAAAKTRDDDLFDIFNENSNFHFPQKSDSTWTSPSYSSGKPFARPSRDGVMDSPLSNSASNDSFASFAGSTPQFDWNTPASAPTLSSASALPTDSLSPSASVLHNSEKTPSATNSFPRVVSSLESQEPISPARPLSVDELIADAMMDDTIHSMKLLHKILNALREENLNRSQLHAPADYWFEMQELVKNQMRRIAQDRQTATPSNSPIPPFGQQTPYGQVPYGQTPQGPKVSLDAIPVPQSAAFHSTVISSNSPLDSASSVTTYPNKNFYQPESLLEETPVLIHSGNNDLSSWKRENLSQNPTPERSRGQEIPLSSRASSTPFVASFSPPFREQAKDPFSDRSNASFNARLTASSNAPFNTPSFSDSSREQSSASVVAPNDVLSELAVADNSISPPKESPDSYSSYLQMENEAAKSQEIQDVALLRSLLQNYPAQGQMDSESRDKLMQIISQLQTINPIS